MIAILAEGVGVINQTGHMGIYPGGGMCQPRFEDAIRAFFQSSDGKVLFSQLFDQHLHELTQQDVTLTRASFSAPQQEHTEHEVEVG